MKVLSTILSVSMMALSVAPVMAADYVVSAPGTMIDQSADLNGGCGARRVHRRSFRRVNRVANNVTTIQRSETISQPISQPAVVQDQVMTQPAVAATCAQPVVCPQVITQPAVTEVAPACGPNPAALLGAALVGAGIATAIALPIALHHGHHRGNRGNNLQQQQLLLFAAQQRNAELAAAVGPTFVPGFGFGTVVPGIGFVPAPFVP